MPDQALAPVDAARDAYRIARKYQRIRKNPALSALAAGTDSNVILPVGETYDALHFAPTIAGVAATKAEMIAQISKIQLIADGDTKIDLTGEDAVMLQEYYQQRSGQDAVAGGQLFLDFNRPWHREISGEDGPAWGTRDVRTLEMIVGLAGGATIDGLQTSRIVRDGESMGRHLCIRRRPQTFASAALQRISEWKRDLGSQLLAIHVKKTTITDVLLTIDNVKEIDCKYALLAAFRKQYERTDQVGAGYSHLDFAVRNRIGDAIPMVAQTMDLDLTWSGAPGAYTLLLEQIEGPADLAN